ncbi:MAG: group intron reverse transcriptase/maturase [Pseudomonadota bacterium]
MKFDGGWVIEADIESFLERLDHGHLREFLDKRVRDGVVRRVIGKWLKAGVMENGQLYCPETGSPQGGVVSPILSNIYLHEVLDLWFVQEFRPRMRGLAEIVRFADDFVISFEHRADAERVMKYLPKRLGRYGLTLHPEKTRIICFERPRLNEPAESPHGESRTFDYLGLTHHWGNSRKGKPTVQRRTMRSRLARALTRVGQWCRFHRHGPLKVQHKMLLAKLHGHYSYYGITGNIRALRKMLAGTQRLWRYWLNRRGGTRHLTFELYKRLLSRWPLPPARIVHSAILNAANA